MNRLVGKYLLLIGWVVVLLLPVPVYSNLRGGFAGAAAETLFPLFGLLAFTLIWSQIMLGSFMRPLEKLYPNIFIFHIGQGILALGFVFAHYLLRLFSLSSESLARYFEFHYDFVAPGMEAYVYLGQAALLLLVLGLVAGFLRHWRWLQRWWHWLHLVHYLVFFLAFFHSWNLGTDVQSTLTLRSLWVFFMLTVIAGIIYRRIYIPSKEGLVKATS